MRKLLLMLALVLLPLGAAHAQVAVHSKTWIEAESKLRFKSWEEKLKGVHVFLNTHPHQLFQSADGYGYYVEAAGAANCQQEATVKQVMLRRLGVETSKLQTVYLRTDSKVHTYLLVGEVGLDSRFPGELTTLATIARQYKPLVSAAPSFTIREMLARHP